MNKITREHFPVSKLPEERRKGFETGTGVGDVVATEAGHISAEKPYHDYDELMASIKPMTWKELYADMQTSPEKYDRGVTIEDAVARVRALRDEWDSDR